MKGSNNKIKITLSETENGKLSEDLEKVVAKEMRENPDFLKALAKIDPEQKRNSKQ